MKDETTTGERGGAETDILKAADEIEALCDAFAKTLQDHGAQRAAALRRKAYALINRGRI